MIPGAVGSRQYLNKAAFQTVPRDPVSRAAIRPGNVGKNSLRDLSRWNLDFSVGKNFSITEQAKVRLRLDMFNAFNHVFRNNLETRINRSNFGLFRGLTGPRVMQLSLRLTF